MIKKVRFIFFILLLGIIPSDSFSQTLGYLWSRSSGSHTTDIANALTNDNIGNTIMVGEFRGDSITFGAIKLYRNTLSTGSDMFIVKYDPLGNVLWAKGFGGPNDETIYNVTTDGSDNICITGTFTSGILTFGSFTLTNTSANIDIFTCKLDPAGNVLWAKKGGGTIMEYVRGITTDSDGSVFISGDFFSSTISFGPVTLTNAGPGMADAFVVKYSPLGNVLWAKNWGGALDDIGYSITTDSSKNLIFAGTFNSATITFGATVLSNAYPSVMFDHFSDLFLVHLDPSGNEIWAKRGGDRRTESRLSLALDADENILIGGNFTGDTTIFETDTLYNSSYSQNDMFLLKYDDTGNLIWAKSAGGIKHDFLFNIHTDSAGYTIITGAFHSPTALFSGTTLTNTSTANTAEIFLVQYDPAGNLTWAMQAGDLQQDHGADVSVDHAGNIYFCGVFEGASLNLGATAHSNVSAGTADVYLAKLGDVTGIENYEKEEQVKIYPNPNDGKFTIYSEHTFSSIKILNLLGEILYSLEPERDEVQIDLQTLSKGIYFVRTLSENKKIRTLKIVVN